MSRYLSSIIENNDPEIDATHDHINNDPEIDTTHDHINNVNPKTVVEKREPTKTMSIEEHELLRKMDIRIIPLFSIFYILGFIDKLNIGNAKLEHIEEDLHLTSNKYNLVLIPTIMLACGIVVICTAAAKDFVHIMVLRFLLGVFEAGFFPGVIFYITKWYKNSEENYRISLFCSAATIAGAFSGLMSFSASTLLHKVNGLNGWQWVFIIDGSFTCAVALFSYYLIPDSPETASWLTNEERKLAVERLNDEPSHAHESYSEIHQILDAFKDWKIYMAMLQYFCINAPLYSFSFYISSIVNSLGFSAVVSQLLATPPFILGCSSSLLIAISSDRTGVRGDAMMIAAGNIGAGISTQFYNLNNVEITETRDTLHDSSHDSLHDKTHHGAPSYRLGHIISFSLLVIAFITCIIKFNLLARENAKKFEKRSNIGMGEEEAMKFGDKHPSFIYSL
ncbi:23950_t:CDS:2 [Racocetra persica]|uniref:23950_t:CDS:1 n=1 Tax=Racocetra persica TaxID=160502 RepID=A0ACA9M4G4_9GLOM|nr:23950_t:CDS:2 [Racocetra persica]